MYKLWSIRILLLLQTLVVGIYTYAAFAREGTGLFAVFLDNLQSFGWNGQFSADFSCYLLLSGLWIAWRQQFSLGAIMMGLVATVLGIIVFAPYLLWLSVSEEGNWEKILLGRHYRSKPLQ